MFFLRNLPLSGKFLLPPLIIIAGLGITTWYAWETLHKQDQYMAVIDVAGRQRLLVARQFHGVLEGHAPVTTPFGDERDLFHSTLHSMFEGGRIQTGASGRENVRISPATYPPLKKNLKSIEEQYHLFEENLEQYRSVSSGAKKSQSLRAELREQYRTLLDRIHTSVQQYRKQYENWIQARIQTVLAMGGGTIALGGLVLLALFLDITRPLRKLRNYAEEILNQDIQARLQPEFDIHRTDIIGLMADSFQRLTHNLTLYQLAFQNAGSAMYITASDGSIAAVNQQFEEQTGYSEEEALGQNPRILKSGEHPRSFYANLWDTILSGGTWQGEIKNQRRSGEIYYVEQTISPLQDESGEIQHFVAVNLDITDRKRMEQKLEYDAYHDHLTGLPNRAYLLDCLEEYRICARNGEDRPTDLVVLYLDVDDMKTVNDLLGHRTGDRFLNQVADRLAGALRSEDVICRVGGDEFVIVLRDYQSKQEVDEVAERLMECFSDYFRIDDQPIESNCSIGIASISQFEGQHSAEELIGRADLAMFEAKQETGNSYCWYDPRMDLDYHQDVLVSDEDQQFEQDLREGRVEPYFQPIIDLSDENIVGFEALARWNHPEQGVLGPGAFLDRAEDQGLLVELDKTIYERSLEFYAAHREIVQAKQLDLHVNLSMPTILAEDVIDCSDSLREESGIPSDRVVLELTERNVFREQERLYEFTRGVRDQGYKVMLDDYGTGYSALNVLRNLPFSGVKIDKEYLKSVKEKPEARNLLINLVSMAQSLDLEVVAEGIEDREQMRILQQREGLIGQGFYFGRPIPAADFAETWLTDSERDENQTVSSPS